MFNPIASNRTIDKLTRIQSYIWELCQSFPIDYSGKVAQITTEEMNYRDALDIINLLIDQEQNQAEVL